VVKVAGGGDAEGQSQPLHDRCFIDFAAATPFDTPRASAARDMEARSACASHHCARYAMGQARKSCRSAPLLKPAPGARDAAAADDAEIAFDSAIIIQTLMPPAGFAIADVDAI